MVHTPCKVTSLIDDRDGVVAWKSAQIVFLKFSFLLGCLPELYGMALHENKGSFENLSPPSFTCLSESTSFSP